MISQYGGALQGLSAFGNRTIDLCKYSEYS